jgi:phage/plasmid-like protein (TIGR03299 family)
MAHNLEIINGKASMFSGSGVTPWHKLGVVLPHNLTAAEAIVAANMDWDVELRPLYIEIPGKSGRIKHQGIEIAKATVRATDDVVLGTVGNAYTPLQNREAFGFIDAILSPKDACIETAGVLDGGRCIWIMVKLPKDVTVKVGRHKDLITKYLLLTNRHDGFGCVTIKMTPVRVVCANTLSQALKGGGIQIRHTASVVSRTQNAVTEEMGLTTKFTENLMARTSEFYANFSEAANAMGATKLNDERTREFLLRCLKRQATEKDLSDAEAVRDAGGEIKVPKALDKCLELVEYGMGADMAKGTLWGAYNALTEYADHHMGYRNDNNRLRNIGFEGNGNALKVRAFAEACKMAKVGI